MSSRPSRSGGWPYGLARHSARAQPHAAFGWRASAVPPAAAAGAAAGPGEKEWWAGDGWGHHACTGARDPIPRFRARVRTRAAQGQEQPQHERVLELSSRGIQSRRPITHSASGSDGHQAQTRSMQKSAHRRARHAQFSGRIVTCDGVKPIGDILRRVV
jgi:hypothetical protein